MNITVNIDDTQMSKLINDGINALDNEAVTNIARQALCKAFENPELSQLILFEKRSIYGDPTELRQWAKNAISQSLTSADYEKFKALVFETIDKHAKDIIVETLAKTLASNLFTYENQNTFGERLVNALRERRD